MPGHDRATRSNPGMKMKDRIAGYVPATMPGHADQLRMTHRVVGKIERFRSLSLVIHDHGEGLGTDIDPDMIELQWSLLFV